LVLVGQIKAVRAAALGVNRKNIYKQNKLDKKDEMLKEEIKKVHLKHKAYGHRRVAWELGINHKRALRVMKKFDLKPPRRKNRHFCTRSTEHNHYINLIKNIIPARPHQVWVSDVSFIKFQGRFWYLATIEDVATRQVLAAQVGKYHDSQLVLTAIKQALTRAVPGVFHSDQGTEFMAKVCTDYLEKRGINISVSAKASPWENGHQESFFGRFKDEFGDFDRFETVGELIEEIYGQIRYYNFERRHYAFKLPPAVYAGQKYSDYCLQKRGT
jgi:transposase InsO family protein